MKQFNRELSTAKMQLLSHKSLGFFAYLLFNLKIIPDSDIETMKTNGIDIMVNPDWFVSLDKDTRIYALMSATMHVALQHPSRMQGREPKQWMAASDYTVNLALHDYGLTVPEGALLNTEFRGHTTEKIYEFLRQENQNPEPDHDDLQKPPVGGDGNSDSGEGEGDSPNSSFGTQQEFQDKVEDLLNQSKVQAKMSDSYSPDGLPEELQRMLADLEKPLLPWNRILARFLNQVSKNAYSWTRPNRRFLPQDIYLPSMSSEGLDRIDFIIDTSGSISEEEFTQFVTEVDKVLKQFKPKEIGVSQFDHMYRGTDMVSATTDIRKLEFKGGGGTRIDTTLEAVSKEPSKCLIIFTDGYMQVKHLPKPPMPVVWAIYDNDHFEEPFGKQIKFTR